MANPTPKNKSTRLQLPVGVAGTEPAVAPEGALAYATDTEVVRVKTSTGWEDVGGGGGGSVTSIDSPDGSIDVTNPGGPTVSVEVDPANVDASGQAHGPLSATVVSGITETGGPTALTIGAINNFQLLQRVGATVVGTAYPATTLVGDVNGPIISNQVNAIHETSGPTQLTIGAISSGQVLIRSGATVIGSTAGTPTGNPYIDPPVTAGSLDDEFETGSADLATRGWTVVNSSNATMSRVGDVLPWDNATGLSTTQYRSTLKGSQLLIQVALGTSIRIYKSKTISSGSGDLFWTRIGVPEYNEAATTTSGVRANVMLWYASGGFPDTNNRLFSRLDSTGSTGTLLITARTIAGVETSKSIAMTAPPQDILGIKLRSGTTAWDTFAATSTVGTVNSMTHTTFSATSVAYVGVELFSVATTGAPIDTTQIFSVDFFRSATGSSAWIAQTPRPVAWNVVNADITNYSSKATPVAADQVYIADSAASNAIKRATLSSLVVGTSSYSPLFTDRTFPDTFDDTFTSGSPDLAARGWTVINQFGGATMTRLGDVVGTPAPNTLSGTQYNSTMTAAGLAIQCSAEMLIYKPISNTLATYSAAVFTSIPTTTTTNWCIGIYNSALPITNSTIRFFQNHYNGSLFLSRMDVNQVYTTLASNGLTDDHTVGCLNYTPGTSTSNTFLSWIHPASYVKRTIFHSNTASSAAFVAAYAGVVVQTNVADNLAWHTIRFIRRYLGVQFPIVGVTP